MQSKVTQAKLFNDLATLCDAGISISCAAKKLNFTGAEKQAWVSVITDLDSGQALHRALAKNKFINLYEQTALSAVETSGYLVEGLRTISESYLKRQARVNRLKIKLYFPFVVVILAVIASGILNIFKNPQLNVGFVFLSGLFWIGLAFVSIRLLLKLMSMDVSGWLMLMACFSHTNWYIMQSQHVIFSALLWQIKAGINFNCAFSNISKIVKNKKLNYKLKRISYYCGQGFSFSHCIDKVALPITDDFAQLILTAEQSGKWQEVLERYLARQEERLDNKIDAVFNMSPRLYYIVVIIMITHVLI